MPQPARGGTRLPPLVSVCLPHCPPMESIEHNISRWATVPRGRSQVCHVMTQQRLCASFFRRTSLLPYLSSPVQWKMTSNQHQSTTRVGVRDELPHDLHNLLWGTLKTDARFHFRPVRVLVPLPAVWPSTHHRRKAARLFAGAF
jgi:hypothetical protein